MAEITRSLIARVGVDLSKRVVQVHAVDRAGRVVLARPVSVEGFFAWCAALPAGCLVAMEACGGAHCQRSAYTGQPRVGIYRPAELVGEAAWRRHIPATAQSA